jgi:serine/threonine protein phosphatase PrpC
MATTAAAVLFGKDGHAHVAHVGDSRVYLLRNKRLQQLTHDHSWVGEQVRAGLLTDEDAQRHPWRNVVTRAISGADDPEVETADVTTQSGDLLMICSDGLSSVVSLEEIEKLLLSGSSGPLDPWTPGPLDLKPACAALIQAANDAGGPDNITVILVQVQ